MSAVYYEEWKENSDWLKLSFHSDLENVKPYESSGYDVVYEEFKGTGNMEMVLDRKVAEKRVFPAIDIPQSGTRRDDLLLNSDEMEAINNIRRAFNGMKAEEAVDKVVDMFNKTKNNREFVEMAKKIKFF